jgi:hypothetical protein
MKSFLVFLLMTSFLASFSFAGETTTECVMMKEENSRNNPKANLGTAKPKTKKPNASAQ